MSAQQAMSAPATGPPPPATSAAETGSYLTRALAQSTGAAVWMLGILVLAGWHLHIPVIIQIHPSLVPMQYNTALGFFAAGVGLICASRGCWHAALIAGGWVSLTGGLNLVQHMATIDLGIDQLFMQHYITTATPQPGRMAPNTALCFTLAGIALLLASCKFIDKRHTERRWRAVGFFSALVFGLATVALMGYVADIPTAYGWGNLTRMAVHTASGFIALSIGLTALSWQHAFFGRDWRPGTIGMAAVTITLCLWQALQSAASESVQLANSFMLAFGLIMSLALARAAAAALKAHQDLAELKRNKEIISELNRDFVSFLENASDFIYFKDVNGRFRFCSQTLANITGHASWRDLIGKHVLEVFPNDTAQIYHEGEVPILRDGKPLLNKVDPYYDASGEKRWVSTNKWPLLDHQGKVVGLLGISRDITERKLAEEKVHQLAFYDALTHLPNRRLLNDRLHQAQSSSKRTRCYGAVMFLDLDNFKPLNDTHGHRAGDLLLVQMAERLRHCVRENDTVARFGGDEFVVMLGELSADRDESAHQAMAIAEKILGTLAAPCVLTPPPGTQDDKAIEHSCTASIGVTLFLGTELEPDDIFVQADAAMYQAKTNGRNKAQIYGLNTELGKHAEQ